MRATVFVLASVVFLSQSAARCDDVADKKDWVQQLHSKDVAKRRAAARSLVGYCTDLNAGAADLTPALIAALKDGDTTVRTLAADALGEIGPDAKAAVPVLMTMLKDKNAAIRARAAFALGGAGANSPEAVPALAHLLKDPDDDVRLNAVSALAEINTKETLPILIAALDDTSAGVRISAASGVGAHGSDAYKAVAELMRLLLDPFDGVRGQAAVALGEIGAEPGKVVPALGPLLKDEHAGVRGDAARGLGSFGKDAKSAAAALTPLLRDADSGVRVLAAEALWRIDGKLDPIASVLSAGLSNKDEFVRGDAAHVVGLIGPPARKLLLPRLLPLLKDGNEGVRIQAAESVWHVDPSHKPAVGVLEAGLKSKDTMVRLEAIRVLGEMGANADVSKSLHGLLSDRHPEIRHAAAEALKKIAPSGGTK